MYNCILATYFGSFLLYVLNAALFHCQIKRSGKVFYGAPFISKVVINTSIRLSIDRFPPSVNRFAESVDRFAQSIDRCACAKHATTLYLVVMKMEDDELPGCSSDFASDCGQTIDVQEKKKVEPRAVNYSVGFACYDGHAFILVLL